MQRQKHRNLQPRGLLQHGLHLRAVFADDVRVVAAGLVEIVSVEVDLVIEEVPVQRAEAAERIRRQQQAVGLVIGHEHLGPVHHRRGHKLQRVAAGAERVALLDRADLPGEAVAEELDDHVPGHGAAEHLHVGIAQDDLLDLGGVVGLHVVDDQIVERAAAQRVGDVLAEGMAHRGVGGIEQDGPFVAEQVAVEAHALRHIIDALEHRQTAPVRADPCIIFIDLSDTIHRDFLLSVKSVDFFLSSIIPDHL